MGQNGCNSKIWQVWVKTSFELPLGWRKSPRNIIPEIGKLQSLDRLYYNPILENVGLPLVGNLTSPHPCVAVTHFILELWTVFSSHGVGEQALVLIMPKTETLEVPDKLFYNPTVENEYLLLWVIWWFFPPCTTVTPLILELLTVFSSHGVREQSLAILCPKKKNWLWACKIFYTPTI